MTFVVTLVFGLGALMLINAISLKDCSLGETFRQVFSGQQFKNCGTK